MYILKSWGHGQDACPRNNKAGIMPRQISLTYIHFTCRLAYIITLYLSPNQGITTWKMKQISKNRQYPNVMHRFVSNWKSIWHIYGFSLVIHQQVYMSNSFVRMCIQDTNSLVDISLLWSESLAHITSFWIKMVIF